MDGVNDFRRKKNKLILPNQIPLPWPSGVYENVTLFSTHDMKTARGSGLGRQIVGAGQP